jgi:hypothetical protein
VRGGAEAGPRPDGCPCRPEMFAGFTPGMGR